MRLPDIPSSACAAILLALCSPAAAHAQQLSRISVSTGGAEADQKSERPKIARDGRYVAFQSRASTLVPGDFNFVDDIFLRDLVAGTTELISVATNGGFGNGMSERPAISSDGRFVAFASDASNLIASDTNIERDIFLRDRLLGTTVLISKGVGGVQANGYSTRPTISADGRFVSYRSAATNLIPLDANGIIDDVFLYDTVAGVTTLVSMSTGGIQGDQASDRPSMSDDGTRIAFYSDSTNLVAGDVNLVRDVFLRDLVAGTTVLVSASSLGAIGNAESSRPHISGNGEYVAYRSIASNLVPGDNNLFEDVFRYQVSNGTVIRVSLAPGGLEADGDSSVPTINADGTKIAYRSIATNLVPGDTNASEDVFLHDIVTGKTTLVSKSGLGVIGDAGSTNPSISGAGDLVGFESSATNLVPGDTNLVQDAFVWSAPPPTVDTIVLVGPSSANPGSRVTFTWSHAPANSPWWLLYSFNLNGLVYRGHEFDLGPPISILTTGSHGPQGTGSWTSPPIPGSVSGRTINFEIAANAGASGLADSNYLPLTIN